MPKSCASEKGETPSKEASQHSKGFLKAAVQKKASGKMLAVRAKK